MEQSPVKKIIHRAETRGHSNYGWLDSHHTFSFAEYHNPQRVHFGVLRVINDDTVAPGRGFDTHPHKDMEIISIPISGNLIHNDSTGREQIIKAGDIQVMSAGTGIMHSEYNHSTTESVHFLQIWIFPHTKNVKPRYDQKTIDPESYRNRFATILSPRDVGKGVWIHQDAYFHLGQFQEGSHSHTLHNRDNGLYVFIIEGRIEIEEEILQQGDGVALQDIEYLSFNVKSPTKILLMEVPLALHNR